jgi:hypothetical protein
VESHDGYPPEVTQSRSIAAGRGEVGILPQSTVVGVISLAAVNGGTPSPAIQSDSTVSLNSNTRALWVGLAEVRQQFIVLLLPSLNRHFM